MYHALVPPDAPAGHRVHVSVAAFEEQMRWLHEAGYHTISLPELQAALARRQLPPRAVVITFDDGYFSLATYAAPVLRRYGFRPVLFLTTDAVGEPDHSCLPGFAQTVPLTDRPLTWPEVRALQAQGWDVQAHSCSHCNHASLSEADLRQEMQESKTCLETHLHTAVRYYAFPYGKYTTPALKALSALGFEAGFSVHPGKARPGNDLRRLPRLEINALCSLLEFRRRVEMGYGTTVENYRSRVRNLLFRSSRLKDVIHRVLDRPGT